MTFRRHLVLFLATGGFVGRIPVGPGTFGSLLGLPLCYALSTIPWPAATAAVAAFAMVSIWIAGEAEKDLGRRDPGAIVIDEIAGMMVALLALPFTATTAIAGFLLFRILDIAKPFPIGYVERRLQGGVGVVTDDLMAGVAANLILRLGLLLWP